MKIQSRFGWLGAAMTVATLGGVTASALPKGIQPPPPGQGRGGFGFGGPRRPATLATLPLSVLSAGLGLSDDQKSSIQQIEKKLMDSKRALMPQPGGDRPDPGTMQATMQKIEALDKQAATDISAVLTADQKQKVPGLLKDAETFSALGLPPELLGTLNLSADQKSQLAAIAKDSRQKMDAAMQQSNGDRQAARQAMDEIRKDTHDKAMAVLTADQKATVTAYIKAHPRPNGGPGGFGGGPPPDGGPGGPPDGGPGGPPPPDGAGPPPDGEAPPPPPAEDAL